MSEFRFIKNKIVYYFILIFILNALEMLLELVASRVMSPYFGNSTFVWTAIIGIILLSSSIGYLIGGKLSEEKKVTEFLFPVLGITAIFIALIPFLSEVLNPLLIGMDVRLGSLLSTVLLFLIPSIMISTITPFLMKSILSSTKHIGDYSGKIHAVIAVGSLFGTFVGGFFLIPMIGTNSLLYYIALCFVALMFISMPKKINKKSLLFFIIVIVGIIIICFLPKSNNLFLGISIDTQYSRILIQDVEYNDRTIRYYNSSGAYSSAMFLDDETELVFDYTKCYNDSLEYNSNIENTLMIGGGAYSFPKYWISHTDKKMTVVEIDEESEKIARKYFKLSEVINKYDSNHERLTLITDDGRVYLNNNKVKYDAIFNDAFSGSIPVTTLTTKEAVMLIYNSLTDKGLYMSNILGEVTSEFVLAEMNTMKTVFPYVYIYKADGTKELSYGNYMVVASKKSLKNKNFLDIDYSKGLILTDDYAPVEKMVGDSYFNHSL